MTNVFEVVVRAFRTDRVKIFWNGKPEPFERMAIFFQRITLAFRAGNNFFSERIAWVTRTDDMTFLFRMDSPSCSRDLCKQIVDDMFDSSFSRFLLALRCFAPSSCRPGVVVSLFRFVTRLGVVSSLRGFVFPIWPASLETRKSIIRDWMTWVS